MCVCVCEREREREKERERGMQISVESLWKINTTSLPLFLMNERKIAVLDQTSFGRLKNIFASMSEINYNV